MKSSSSSLRLVAIAALAQTCMAKIHWQECENLVTGDLPADCATLEVPLDYTDTNSTKTLELELVRIRAQQTPSKGSIIYNLGGPGVPGRGNLLNRYAYDLQITGGQFDLVTFDPRGTNNTLPFTCFENAQARLAALNHSPEVWQGAITGSGFWAEASDTAVGQIWAAGQIIADQCDKQHGKQATLLGTSFTARDIMEIVDALEEDGMLRYWGGSYGTALGAVLAAKFPEKIDRMVLDAVLDPEAYYGGSQEEQVADTDELFSFFFKACVESPEFCSLARGNTSAIKLENTVWTLLDDIRRNPVPANGSIIDISLVKSGIFNGLHNPISWPGMANGLDYLLRGDNLTGAAFIWNSLGGSTVVPGLNPLATAGIRCADRLPRHNSFSKFQEAIVNQFKVSRVAGSAHSIFDAACAQWMSGAKERFDGSFQTTTKTPVLIIGNTLDPITPLSGARRLSTDLNNSVLLHHDGYGHGSSAHLSTCTLDLTAAYYINGTLPESGIVCKPDLPAFEVLSGLQP